MVRSQRAQLRKSGSIWTGHAVATPELLQAFVDRGGLPRDLEAIAQAGKDAEHANLGQSSAAAIGSASTADVAVAFADLQRDYKAIMAVLRAVRDDLEDALATSDVISAVDQILVDETAVHIKIVKGEGDRTIRKSLKKLSQEAIRAEIRKDAAALLDQPKVVEAMTARKVDVARLTQLRDRADALNERLATRIADKAERKNATARENDAVRAQRRKWGAVYRILNSLHDERVQGLLSGATRL